MILIGIIPEVMHRFVGIALTSADKGMPYHFYAYPTCKNVLQKTLVKLFNS
jgi:hypothetical protein